MNKIKISVIIPVYNTSKYLSKCLDSIINQSLKEIEIICINDGSTDNSLEILKYYQSQDNRIKLINKKNEGVSQARNIGIIESKGKYLAFIDSDDWIEERFLEEAYNLAKSNELDMVAYDMIKDYVQKKKSKIYQEFVTEKIIDGYEYRKLYLDNKVLRGIANKIVKKKIFLDNNLYFPVGVKSGEDMSVTLKLGYLISKVGKINKTYYHYIQHNESVTKEKGANKIYSFLKVFDDIENFVYKNNKLLYEKEKNKIFSYKIKSIHHFVLTDSDWKSEEYIKAVNLFIQFTQDSRSENIIKEFKFLSKITWKIVRKFPNIKTIKILKFFTRWVILLKEYIYFKFYV